MCQDMALKRRQHIPDNYIFKTWTFKFPSIVCCRRADKLAILGHTQMTFVKRFHTQTILPSYLKIISPVFTPYIKRPSGYSADLFSKYPSRTFLWETVTKAGKILNWCLNSSSSLSAPSTGPGWPDHSSLPSLYWEPISACFPQINVVF